MIDMPLTPDAIGVNKTTLEQSTLSPMIIDHYDDAMRGSSQHYLKSVREIH